MPSLQNTKEKLLCGLLGCDKSELDNFCNTLRVNEVSVEQFLEKFAKSGLPLSLENLIEILNL